MLRKRKFVKIVDRFRLAHLYLKINYFVRLRLSHSYESGLVLPRHFKQRPSGPLIIFSLKSPMRITPLLYRTDRLSIISLSIEISSSSGALYKAMNKISDAGRILSKTKYSVFYTVSDLSKTLV